MTVCAVGCVAFDTIETPFALRERVLGGSAVYFALGASLFTDVRLVAAVGTDCPDESLGPLAERDIDLSEVERLDGRTLTWHGRYGYELGSRETVRLDPGVTEDFLPELRGRARPDVLFLATAPPRLQTHALQRQQPKSIIAIDTMDIWIDDHHDELSTLFSKADVLLINDGEARQLAKLPGLVQCANRLLHQGPRLVCVKLGEYGVAVFTDEHYLGLHAYPLDVVMDPTGAGDAFAGAFLGYLDATTTATDSLDMRAVSQAMLFGTAVSSFAVEGMGTEALLEVDMDAVNQRQREISDMVPVRAHDFTPRKARRRAG